MKIATRVAGLLRAALGGYVALGRAVGGILLFLLTVAATTAAVVVPMWLLATRLPGVFSGAVVVVFAAALAVYVFARVRAHVRRGGTVSGWARLHLAPALLRLVRTALLFVSLYGLILLIASGRYILGSASALALILLVGLWADRRRRAARRTAPVGPADDKWDGGSE
jgi:Ca2+/Na+ antiporter